MDAKLNLSRRKELGKKARLLKEDGKVLANIFGKGLESIAVAGEGKEVERIVSAAGKSKPIEVTVDGKDEHLVLVDDVERDYITRKIHHVSLRAVVKGQKVTAEVPIHFTGESPAARLGLIVVTLKDSVEVEAIPSKLPEFIEISLDALAEDGDSIHLSDIADGASFEIKEDGELLVAKVDTPRAQAEDDEEEDAEEVDAGAVPSAHGSDDGESEDDKNA